MSKNLKLFCIAIATAIVLLGSIIWIAVKMPAELFTVSTHSLGFTHEVSTATIKAVDEYARRYSSIGGISLVSLDFQHNKRASVLERAFTPQIADHISPGVVATAASPIFTENAVQNAEMSALVNGKFNCRPSSEGQYVKWFNTGALVSVTCRIPISPEVGRLVGYIAIHLITAPDLELRVKLEQETRLLAYTIYYNEFVPVPRR